jgi:hypothetical protein
MNRLRGRARGVGAFGGSGGGGGDVPVTALLFNGQPLLFGSAYLTFGA